MSQPIVLFNADGEQVTLYAPTYARQQVGAGLLFLEPPLKVEVSTTVDTSISLLSVKQLKSRAKAAGVTGYSRMSKSKLIKALE